MFQVLLWKAFGIASLVRLYTPEDSSKVAKLLESVKHITVYSEQHCNPEDLASNLQEMLDNKNVRILVNQNGEEITGIHIGALCHSLWNNSVMEASDVLFVAKGCGRALLREYVAWAKDHGASVRTHCGSGNARTERWYEEMGATRLGSIWEIK